MKSNLFLRVIIFIATFFCGITSYAAVLTADNAVYWAEEKGRLLLDTFHEQDINLRYQKLDELFDEYIDVNYIAKFVVGKYWRSMSLEQQHKYLKVFERYLKALYKTFPLDFVQTLNYKVTDAFAEKDFVIVNVVINVQIMSDKPQEDMLLSFRLHNTHNGLKLVDIKVAESSLLLSYRSKFYEQIAAVDGEIEWFLEDLEDMVNSANAHNQANISQK